MKDLTRTGVHTIYNPSDSGIDPDMDDAARRSGKRKSVNNKDTYSSADVSQFSVSGNIVAVTCYQRKIHGENVKACT